MRSTNIAGQAYSLLVLTPICPGEEDALRACLEGLDPQDSPLAKLPRTHMARWIVVADMPSPPGRHVRDPLGGQFLLFTSNFDGDVDSYLHELCELMAPEAAAIWSHCVGCPRPAEGAALKAYLHRNQIDSGFAFAAYGQASVARVRTALDKRERLIAFAVRAQEMEPAERRAAFLEQFGGA
ncbi:MAG: hypothetical protein ACRDLN_15110 [Solirubrobacteraceae bacterium]